MKLGELALRIKTAFQSIYSDGGNYGSNYAGWLGTLIREPFAGAWQRNVTVESAANILAFSAVYACVALISNDISKLRIKLIQQSGDETTWTEAFGSPLGKVMQKPNRYQTRIQFISQWITMKLLYGNVYVLKERDKRGVVVALYLLDPRGVVPLMTEDGEVYYQVNREILAGVENQIVIPASEIMHDRMVTLWHPLIGVTPIYACGAAATQGIRIQANSAKFFENMSRPSGHLTTTGTIKDETANRLKLEFEKNFGGGNIGRLLVTGDGLKYEPMTIPAADSQLIEQLRWTVEDVARAFLVPDYKIITATSGRAPAANLSALNQDYYNQTLQIHIESIEILLREGLSLPDRYDVEMDLDGLLRMDPLSRAETYKNSIGAGYLAPNEARQKENLAPAEGGNTPFLQQQYYSLAALAKRDALDDPFKTAGPAPALPAPTKSKKAKKDPDVKVILGLAEYMKEELV